MASSTFVAPIQLAKSSINEFASDSTRKCLPMCTRIDSYTLKNLSSSVSFGGLQSFHRRMFIHPKRKQFSGLKVRASGEKFFESDPHFIDASVIEAVEVQSGAAGFVLRMRNGKVLRCKHNDSIGARLLHYPPQPAMVLKTLDDSNLLLPILVGESSRSMLLQSLRKETTARPTIYAVILDMVEKMGYEPQLVRITHREKENYVARLYLTMFENSNAILSLDVRPSDAINVAVKAKIPIQVSKSLVFSDGLRVIGNELPFSFSVSKASESSSSSSSTISKIDSVSISKEFNLVSLMELAIMEERYDDAAQLRDELNKFRRGIKQKKV